MATTKHASSPRLLSSSEVTELSHALPLWTFVGERGGRVVRTFYFGDFVEAFSFMTAVALVAEQTGHHPEWRNVYNRVEITLTTHDVEGLSDFDSVLASAIDEIGKRHRAQAGTTLARSPDRSVG